MRKSKRKEDIDFTAFYSYISPDAEGVVKNISGIDKVRDQMNPNERIQSYIRKGDTIYHPTSNDDFRGTMYIITIFIRKGRRCLYFKHRKGKENELRV